MVSAIKAKQTSKNVWDKISACVHPVHSNQRNGDLQKEQNKQRKMWGFGLPLLGEGDFHCRGESSGAGILGPSPRVISCLIYELV